MKKLLFISILVITTLFFAFNKLGTNDRPKGVDQDQWVKINDELGILIDTGKAVKKKQLGSNDCTGKIMFKKGDKWFTLIYQSDDTKIYNKFLNK
jgi:hypothetical protein